MRHFMTKEERELFMEKNMLDLFDQPISNSILLSKHLRRPISTRSKLNGNENVIGIGGVESGKSMALALPNIMQRDCSYVITDPGGNFLRTTGLALEKEGYEIKALNLLDQKKSHHYNPLVYVKDEFQLQDLFQCIVANSGKSEMIPFPHNNEYYLFAACVLYLANNEEKKLTLKNVADMIRTLILDPTDHTHLNKVFECMPLEDRARVAYMHIYCLTPEERKACAIHCLSYLYPFLYREIQELTLEDELSLEQLGKKKMALFIITPLFERTYTAIVPVLYTQILRILCKEKENHPPVKLIMDEFASYGIVPILGQYLAATRQYNVSVMILLKNLEQLKQLYKDTWKSILANSGTIVLLSSPMQLTANMELCTALFGLETEQMVKQFENFLISEQHKNQCIVKMLGLPPCIDTKINFKKLSAYRETAYSNMTNSFSITHLVKGRSQL